MALVGILRRLVQIAVALVVLVVVAGILLYVVGESHKGTGHSVFALAARLVQPFRTLTHPHDARTRIAVNFGVGAVVWLVGAAIVDRLLAVAQRRSRNR